jgi:transcriptional regulator with XRE-family HTH domain
VIEHVRGLPVLPSSIEQSYLAILGEQVRDARMRRKWSQTRLAVEAGTTAGTVRNVEYAKAAVDVVRLFRIALALKIVIQVPHPQHEALSDPSSAPLRVDAASAAGVAGPGRVPN